MAAAHLPSTNPARPASVHRASPTECLAAGPLAPPSRLQLVALERPTLGPGTLAAFPARLRAAVRAVLLIAAHGQVVHEDGELSVEQLALLCCYR